MNLKRFNLVTLSVGVPMQLLTGMGTYYVQIFNLGPGNLFIKGDGTVVANDPESYQLPPDSTLTPLVSGVIWILADQAGTASVALIPKS